MTPEFPAQDNRRCIRFWYTMNGLGVGRLMMYVVPVVKGGTAVRGMSIDPPSSLVWYKTGHQGIEWIYEVLDLGEILKNYFVSRF